MLGGRFLEKLTTEEQRCGGQQESESHVIIWEIALDSKYCRRKGP